MQDTKHKVLRRESSRGLKNQLKIHFTHSVFTALSSGIFWSQTAHQDTGNFVKFSAQPEWFILTF